MITKEIDCPAELFNVILDTEENVKIQFSEYLKSKKSVEELENLLRTNMEEHITPIIEKIIQEIF